MTDHQYSTFWEILTGIGIEIPAIQRDYAQGRDSGRIPVIRRKFINALLLALEKSSPSPLRLDFVYGKIYGEKNEEEIRKNSSAITSLLKSIRDYADSIDLIVPETGVTTKSNDNGQSVFLIPLDGQQRLTALFLIHWFVLSKLGNRDQLGLLKRFRYKTRKSTELFIEMLCSKDVKFLFDDSLKEEIVNHETFSNTWLDDPTVKSMLNVLEEIHDYFKKKTGLPDYQLIWTNLTDRKILHFDFLNLKNFSLSDDLYVKMNARGKELSEFENFKAWLFGKIEHEKWISEERWKDDSLKFDVEWNDLFWTYKEETVFEIDTAYFNFFKIVYVTDLVLKTDLVNSAFKEGENKEDIDNIMNNTADFDFERIYQNDFRDKLSCYFDILNYCSGNVFETEKYEEEVSGFFRFLFNNTSKIAWTDLIKNYSIIAFIEANSDSVFDKDHFNEYYRVLSNLYNNQTFDSPQLYKNALRDIKKINSDIKEHNSNTHQWLSNVNTNTFTSVFTKDQVEEEILKSALINSESDRTSEDSWNKLICKAEAHPYFKGKIGFLLKMSNNDKDLFRKYSKKIGPLFESDILNHKDYLMQRALLTFGNYFGNKDRDKRSFFKNDGETYRSRRENWLGFLTDGKKNQILISLVDDSLYNDLDIKNSLQLIIDRFISQNPATDYISQKLSDLKYHQLYIYCKKLFKYGDYGFIRLANEKYGYQLNASNTGGYFNDLLCEYMKFTYFPDNDAVISRRTKGWENSPSILVGNESLKLVPYEDVFVVEDEETGNETGRFKSLEEVIEYIEKISPAMVES